jgi:hypothetical protein
MMQMPEHVLHVVARGPVELFEQAKSRLKTSAIRRRSSSV